MEFEVLIAGGGPSGSYLAHLLSKKGISVALFEEKEKPDKHLRCSGIVSRSCFEKFSLPREAVLREERRAFFISPSGIKIELSREEPEAFILRRDVLDEHFFNLAKSSGAFIFPNTKVMGIGQNQGVEFITSQGVFKGKVGVIATGFLSSLKSFYGGYSDFIMAVQAEARVFSQDIEIYFRKGVIFGWLIPLGRKGLVGLLSRRDVKREMRRFVSMLRSSGKIGDVGEYHVWGVPLRSRGIVFGDVILVGDSASQVKPTTGGGIYWGLVGASLASRAVEERIFKGKSLSSYRHMWRSLMGFESDFLYFVRKFFEGLDDDSMDLLFRIGGEALKRAVSSSFSFDFHSRIFLGAIKLLLPSLLRLKNHP